MNKKTNRAKSGTPKAGVTKTPRRSAPGGKLKKEK